MEPHEYYADELRKCGLTEEQVKQALVIVRQAALDAVHDTRIREWAAASASLQI